METSKTQLNVGKHSVHTATLLEKKIKIAIILENVSLKAAVMPCFPTLLCPCKTGRPTEV